MGKYGMPPFLVTRMAAHKIHQIQKGSSWAWICSTLLFLALAEGAGHFPVVCHKVFQLGGIEGVIIVVIVVLKLVMLFLLPVIMWKIGILFYSGNSFATIQFIMLTAGIAASIHCQRQDCLGEQPHPHQQVKARRQCRSQEERRRRRQVTLEVIRSNSTLLKLKDADSGIQKWMEECSEINWLSETSWPNVTKVSPVRKSGAELETCEDLSIAFDREQNRAIVSEHEIY